MVLPPERPSPYLVFSQQPRLELDLSAWSAHAARFFECTLERGPSGVVVRRGPQGAPHERDLVARPRVQQDLTLALVAEERAGGGGLGRLAARCQVVWEVARLAPRDGPALRLAAILASVHLGPIVDADGPEIFGVKTARARLEALEA